MKRRISKKIEKYNVLPRRLINKCIYLILNIQRHMSLGLGSKVYIRTRDGRVWIYSYIGKDGRCYHGKGYYLWNGYY